MPKSVESKRLPTKEAVIFILDTSASMNQSFASSSSSSSSKTESSISTTPSCTTDTINRISTESTLSPMETKLSISKKIITKMICNLMHQSKANEVGIVLLKTKRTNHHLYYEQSQESVDGNNTAANIDDTNPSNKLFPNITVLHTLQKPNTKFLQSIQTIQYDDNDTITIKNGGTFIDGIIIAADSMFYSSKTKQESSRRNHTFKKFNRKIILLTDASHQVSTIDWLGSVLTSLKQDLNCTLTVFGFDFDECFRINSSFSSKTSTTDDGEYDGSNKKADEFRNSSTTIRQDKLDSTSTCINVNDPSEQNDPNISIRTENIKLLMSAVQYVGGEIIPIQTREQVDVIQKSFYSNKRKNSMLSKIDFIVAPGLSVPARISYRTYKGDTLPTLKTDALLFDSDGTVKMNSLGDLMTSEITKMKSHWDVDDSQQEVGLDQRSDAFGYGSDYICIGPLDLEGLKIRSPPSVTILGYARMDSIPLSCLMGPTRILSGGESDSSGDYNARSLISSLAVALLNLKMFAICTFVSKQDSDPIMGILAPLIDNSSNSIKESVSSTPDTPCHLSFINMPFADDFQPFNLRSFQDIVSKSTKEEESTCDNFIDAFMLPDEAIRTENISHPVTDSFYSTISKRAIDPSYQNMVCCRDEMIMSTPITLFENGKEALNRFREVFPLQVTEMANAKGKKNLKQNTFWTT